MRAAGIVVAEDFSCCRGLPSFSEAAAPFRNRNLALLDVLGKSILTRTISRLQWHGIQPVSVVSNSDLARAPHLDWDASTADFEYNPSGDQWQPVQHLIFKYAKEGVKAVVVIRLGPYTELNYFDVLRFHETKRKLVTFVADSKGPLQIAAINLTGPMESLEFFQNLCSAPLSNWDCSSSSRYVFNGYVNRLESPSNLRQLARDALLRRCELQPVGNETNPGVWLGPGAQVHARARIIAPAYIGAHTKIRAAAVVARASSIEHHCEVDCATIIDDAHVLPFSYLGAGLAVAHALVDGDRLLQLANNLELQIRDRRLLGPTRSSSRILELKRRAVARMLNTVFPKRVPPGVWANSFKAFLSLAEIALLPLRK